MSSMRSNNEDPIGTQTCFVCGEEVSFGGYWQGFQTVAVCQNTECWEKLLHLALDAAWEFSIIPAAVNEISSLFKISPGNLEQNLARIRKFSSLWVEKCEKVFWYKHACRLESLLRESAREISKAEAEIP